MISDRISSIDQLSDDFFKNTQERRALLPAAIRKRVKHLTIHSQSDDIFASEEDMRKSIVSGGENGGETIVFSTIQSAFKSTDGNIGYDLIIIDEADNSIRSE